MRVEFEKEKETKNTIRFMEKTDSEDKALGQIYVPKATLKDIGWKDGDTLVVELSVE